MHSRLLQILSFSASIALRATASPYPSSIIDTTQFKPSDIITRDVAIIGGGSAGTYSAISLKDKGKSVIVVERTNRLGGHTQTYVDPATGATIDLGVIMFHDVPVVHDYFARFNIPLIKFGSDADPNAPPTVSAAYDLRTSKPVNVTAPTAEAVGAAFAKYSGLLSQWPRLNDGMFLPNPVPDDLVLPLGQFVKKYGIEAVIPTMYQFNPGLGDILTVPTIEEARNFGLELVQAVASGLLTTARHQNDELYSKAQAELLGVSSLLLGSQVVAADRADGNKGVKLVVDTPKGRRLIKAKKLLITIPPRLEFLRPFDLSPNEAQTFGKLIDGGYYLALVKNTGIPDNTSISNMVQNTEYNLPVLPAIYGIGATPVAGLKHIFYGAPVHLKRFHCRMRLSRQISLLPSRSSKPRTPASFRKPSRSSSCTNRMPRFTFRLHRKRPRMVSTINCMRCKV